MMERSLTFRITRVLLLRNGPSLPLPTALTRSARRKPNRTAHMTCSTEQVAPAVLARKSSSGVGAAADASSSGIFKLPIENTVARDFIETTTHSKHPQH